MRESHGFVVQHLVAGRPDDLGSRRRATQQAASKVVTELAAAGVVTRAGRRPPRASACRACGRRAVTEARAARRRVDRRLVRVDRPRRAPATARRAMLQALRALGGLEAICRTPGAGASTRDGHRLPRHDRPARGRGRARRAGVIRRRE
ncbi:MAG: hypothetical protein R2752_10300 [Vicinamibacterales bacterium]